MREIRFRNSNDASMYNKGYQQGRADERERIIRELEKVKASAVDKVKLPNFIRKDIKELTDICFDEAIEIVRGGENERRG